MHSWLTFVDDAELGNYHKINLKVFSCTSAVFPSPDPWPQATTYPLSVTSVFFFSRILYKLNYTGWGKSRFTAVSMQNTVYSCIIVY